MNCLLSNLQTPVGVAHDADFHRSHEVNPHAIVVAAEADLGIECEILVVAAQDDLVATGLTGELNQGANNGRAGPFPLVVRVRGDILDVTDGAAAVQEFVFEDQTGGRDHLVVFGGNYGSNAGGIPPTPNVDGLLWSETDFRKVGQGFQESPV